MNVEIILRGYPSRMRFPEWQRANLLSEKQLPKLSNEQRARARKLGLQERAYAVGIKAAELASERAAEKMERVARVIAETVTNRDQEAELTTLVWDFYQHRFEFTVQHKVGPAPRECIYSVPTDIVDDLLLDRNGAESRLKQAVERELTMVVG